MLRSGTSALTTLPAATMAPSPTVTPPRTVTDALQLKRVRWPTSR
jgi:hypothetical protein